MTEIHLQKTKKIEIDSIKSHHGRFWRDINVYDMDGNATSVIAYGPAENLLLNQASGIEGKVCEDIAQRQQKGIVKYGTTVEDNPLTRKEWLQHAYEEALDLAVYLKKLIEGEGK